MALKAFKLLSRATETTWNRTGNRQLSAVFVQRFASNSQDQAQAFWDDEGSVSVDQNKISERQPLENTKSNVKPKEAELSDFVRHTKFGHIRLDSDNIPSETSQPAQESDPLNYIDEQFFGVKVSDKLPAQNNENQITSKDVPQDTNKIDQQYFYPNQAEKDTKTSSAPTLSAAELDFSENEVDHQYFGSNTNKTAHPKTNSLKVSAYDYLYKKVQDPKENKIDDGTRSNDEHWKKYITMIPDLTRLPNEAICAMLKKNILYNKDGLVVLDKPYGLVTTDADKNAPIVLTNFLPRLSEKLGFKRLHTVHRLDRDTTGILLLASDERMASDLHKMFANHEIRKRYLAVTKGIPSPKEGTIEIPLYEKVVFGRQKMALRPVMPHSEDVNPRYNTKVKSHRALTHFRVIRSAKSAAFVELEPETGVRHQLRVHLSEALSCPILGDHKYSHDDRYAPQKLPKDLLDSLKIQQAKVRNIPMHLHAVFLSIPGLGAKGEPLEIRSPLPQFFRHTLKKLGFYSSKS